jgi:hypothetical protein
VPGSKVNEDNVLSILERDNMVALVPLGKV